MRVLLASIVAVVVAIGGLFATSVVFATYDGAALAATAKAQTKKSKKPVKRKSTAHTTGFEHQQCSVQNPCSTRNDW
jgi:hypothetical protein